MPQHKFAVFHPMVWTLKSPMLDEENMKPVSGFTLVGVGGLCLLQCCLNDKKYLWKTCNTNSQRFSSWSSEGQIWGTLVNPSPSRNSHQIGDGDSSLDHQ